MYSVSLFKVIVIGINALPFKTRQKYGNVGETEVYITANEVGKFKEELVWGSKTSIDNNNGVTTARSNVKIEHVGHYFVMIQNKNTGGDWVRVEITEEPLPWDPKVTPIEYEVQHFWSEKCIVIGEFTEMDGRVHEVRTSEWNLRKTVVIILCISIGVVVYIVGIFWLLL